MTGRRALAAVCLFAAGTVTGASVGASIGAFTHQTVVTVHVPGPTRTIVHQRTVISTPPMCAAFIDDARKALADPVVAARLHDRLAADAAVCMDPNR